MPICFSLTPIGSQDPAKLQAVDDAMRQHFNEPADPDQWLNGWYNYIGFFLAFGWSYEKLAQDIDGECLFNPVGSQPFAYWARMRDILGWLKANYNSDSWREMR